MGAGNLPTRLSVATLGKTHGVRGELKLRCSPDFFVLLQKAADDGATLTLHMPDSGDEFEVTFAHVRGVATAPIVAIDGVESREEAEEFRGASVFVPRELIPAPDDDEFFLADLQACTVFDEHTGDTLGTVERAEALPANVVLTVRFTDGRVVLVPFIDDAVPTVDIEQLRLGLNVDFLALDEGEA